MKLNKTCDKNTKIFDRVAVTKGRHMARKRIRHEKGGAKRGAFHKQPAKCEGCEDYEKCRQRSFPEGCYWRDGTPLDFAVRLGM